MAQGRFAEAVAVYQELVKALPDETGLLLNLALAEHMAGQARQAIGHFEAVLRKQPASVPALFSVAACHLELNQPRLAIEPLRKVVAAEPANVEAGAMLADALFELQRYSQAVEQYQALAKTAPGEPRAWFGLGRAYEALATRAFGQLEKTAPQSAYMAVLLAETRVQRRQYPSAFLLYRQALDQIPGLEGVHAGLAEVYRRTGHGEWAAVEEEREKALPSPDCTARRAACQYRAGQYREAATDAARERTPEALFWETKACNELARQAYAQLGKLAESAQIHEVKATILRGQGQHIESAQEWREALRVAGGNRQYEQELATSLYMAGDYKAALPQIEQCLKADSDSASLNLLEGDSWLHLEEAERAIPFLEKALRRDPKLLGAHAALGLAYARTGKSAQAIPHLEAALGIDEDGSLHYQLARAYQAAGKEEKARQTMAQYQEIQRKAQADKDELPKEAAISAPR